MSTSVRTAAEMAIPGLLFLALAQGRSPGQAGLLVATLVGTGAVTGPVVGVVLDRSRHTQVVFAAATLLMAAGLLLLIAGIKDWAVWGLVTAAAMTGAASPVVAGGWTAQLPRMVSESQLPRALALDAGTYNVAGIIGPTIAAGLATLEPRWAVAGSTVLLIASAAAVFAIPLTPALAPENPHLLHHLYVGMTAMWSTTAMRQVVVTSTIAYAGFGAVVLATPLLAQRWTGHSQTGGLLLTGYAAGALISTAVLAHWPTRKPPERLVITAAFGIGCCLIAAAFAPNLAVAATLYAVAGIADGPLLVGTFAVRHRDAPPVVRSQVFTTAASLKIGAFAAGMAVAGAVQDAGGSALLLAGVLHVGAAVAGGWSSPARQPVPS